ncbi:MAG: hypothetical protein NVS4B3_18210 [Gemmatimonadaceae bacterium]
MARAARPSSRADSVLFGGCLLLSLVAHGLPDKLRDPVAGGMRRTVIAPLVALQHGAELWRDAWLSHDSRQLARDSVSLGGMQTAALATENDRLRKLLGLGQQVRWGFVAAEALHSPAMGEEYTVTLSAGANAGVRRFSPVIAPEGLVGMVETVDPTMSLAIVWAHPDFRVSAMAADGAAFGIAAAHLGSGPERYLLELRGVQFRTPIKAGTLVVSSGLGGVYPRGIPIGTIIGEAKTSEGFVHTYLVRPAVLPANISAVMVLQTQRVSAGIEGLWATARGSGSADSTGRRDTTHRLLSRKDGRVVLDPSPPRAPAQRQAAGRASRDTAGASNVAVPRAGRPDAFVGADSMRRTPRTDTSRGDTLRPGLSTSPPSPAPPREHVPARA